MLYEYLRLLRYNGTSFTDNSLLNQEEGATNTLNLATTDYMYIGQYYPFNNFFIYSDTPNVVSAAITIQYWDGKSWQDAVDILDGTSVSGATLARSGNIQFSPNRKYNWNKIDSTEENYAPVEMQSLKIYGLYWLRFKVNASLTATTKIKTLSYAFTTTQQLNNLDVEINTFYDSFSSGKNNWIPEIITASKLLVNDLKRMGLILHAGNILRFDDVSVACDWKTLWLIYSNLGKAYVEKRNDASNQVKEALSIERFTFDQNLNALVDNNEIQSTVRSLVR